jgi:hypothetical protein
VARKQSEILRNTIWISAKLGLHNNLAILTTEIMKTFEERATVSAIFLDIRSAYDNVHCSTFRDRLKAGGFSRNLLALIFILVSSRELEAKYGWPDLKDWTYKGLHRVVF